MTGTESRLPARLLRDLHQVATGQVEHIYHGLCPDPLEGFDSREAPGNCAACDILREVDHVVA
jgi:hypothetical protein